MHVSGHEQWSASEIADRLMGDDITPGDIEGLHGAVIVLCKRVAELEGKLDKHSHSLPASIQEALNSGDGSYRP